MTLEEQYKQETGRDALYRMPGTSSDYHFLEYVRWLENKIQPPSPDVVGDNGLKPCPFCGGEAELSSWEIDGCTHAKFKIKCKQCEVSLNQTNDYFTSRDGAVRAWNKRV